MRMLLLHPTDDSAVNFHYSFALESKKNRVLGTPMQTADIDTMRMRPACERLICGCILVVRSLREAPGEAGAAAGHAVAAARDTDCNSATAGALWGLTGAAIRSTWAGPVGHSLAGFAWQGPEDPVARTVAFACDNDNRRAA